MWDFINHFTWNLLEILVVDRASSKWVWHEPRQYPDPRTHPTQSLSTLNHGVILFEEQSG